MKSIAAILSCLFALAATAAAQPAVNAGGIVNAASYALPALPNGGIAQGSMFLVFGANLGTASDVSQLKFPLQTHLGGTSVAIVSGAVTSNALMIYTTPTQLAAVLPSNTPVGRATIVVTVNGQASAAQPFNVVKASFGMFTRNQAGSGPVIAQNFVSATDQPLNALTTVANPGQLVTLWGTGLGPVAGDESAGPLPGQTALPVEVIVGGIAAPSVIYAGRSGCCAALDQVTFKVPASVQGCNVPVFVRANGIASNFGSMSIMASGAACSDQGGLATADVQKLAQGARAGVIALNRLDVSINAQGLGSAETKTDSGTGLFTQYTGNQFLSSQGPSGLPSAGYCTVQQFVGSQIIPTDPVTGSQLDAGVALNITGPNGSKQIAKTSGSKGAYAATLSGGGIGATQTGYLDPGTYKLDNGTGGADVGAFSASLTVPPTLTWTNRTTVTAAAIPRTQALTLTWSGGDPNSLVEILGASAVSASAISVSGGATLICAVPASAGQFTVPADILGALPASSSAGALGAGGFLLIGTSGQPVRFTATGIDFGQIFAVTLAGNTVTFM